MHLFSKLKSSKHHHYADPSSSVTNTGVSTPPSESRFRRSLSEENLASSEHSSTHSTLSLTLPPHHESDNPFSELQKPSSPNELGTPPPSPHRKSSDDSEEQFENQVQRIQELLSSKRDQFLSGARIRDKCEVAKTRMKEKVELSYAVFGNGTQYKVMFVMGLNGVGATWFLQTEYFSKLENYQVCVFDNRGIGNSSSPKGFYSTKTMAEDALDLLDHLGWTSDVHLVGVSLGGMIVQKMVSLQPDRFSTLVCTSTFHASFDLIPTSAEVKYFLTAFHKPWNEQIDPLLRLCFPKQWLNAEVKKGVNVTNYQFILMAMEELNKLSPPQTKEASLSQMHSTWVHYTTPKECKTIRHSKVRTLVIHGTKDKVIRYQCGKVLSKALKCPLITFERCGHMVMIEQPVRYNQVLQAHIEGRLIESNAQIIPLDTHFEISPLPAYLSRPCRTESEPTLYASSPFTPEIAPRSLTESPDQEPSVRSSDYLSPFNSSDISKDHHNQDEHNSHTHHKHTRNHHVKQKTSWLHLKLPLNSIKINFSKEPNRPEYATT